MLTQLAIIQLFSCVIINVLIWHLCWIFVLCRCFWELAFVVLEIVVYPLWCCLHLFIDIYQPVLVPGWCCFCDIHMIALLCQLVDSCRLPVFQRVKILMFNCVPLSAVLNGVFLCDHWCPRCHHPWWCNCLWHPLCWYCDCHPRRCSRWHFPR